MQAGKLARQEAAAAQEAAGKAAEAQLQQQAAQAEHLQQANRQLTSELQKAQVGWRLISCTFQLALCWVCKHRQGGVSAWLPIPGRCGLCQSLLLLAAPGCCLRQLL